MSEPRIAHNEALPAAVDVDALLTYLDEQPDVVAAYVFGSHAEGRAHAQSDIDIAILLQPYDDDDFERRLTLMSALEDFAGARTDVVVLNGAPPLLQHEILKHGRLFYERDRAARVEFGVSVMKMYDDVRWNNTYFARAWFESLQNADEQTVKEMYVQMRLLEHEVERLKQDRVLLLAALKRVENA